MISFTEKYHDLGARFESMKKALELLDEHQGKIIVETGTTRMENDWGGGMSTLIFGEYCKENNAHLFTCDIKPEAIEISQKVTQEFSEFITYITADSLDFLERLNHKIDLLYLDSMDCPEYDSYFSPNLIASQVHQLKEMEIAFPKLQPNAIVLLDDNNFENGGKPKLTKYFLRDHGYKEIMSTQQSLWII